MPRKRAGGQEWLTQKVSADFAWADEVGRFLTSAEVRSGLEQCTVLHVDMDCVFAAVEVLDDPGLAHKPLIVGGTGSRGVVASCNYEARAYGVRSAMSSVEARRRCPVAVFLPGRHRRYAEVSGQLSAVLNEFTPVVEPIGLDEAFLDISGTRRLLGSPWRIGEAIRDAVRSRLGLECSVGIARSKLLAKLASRAAKPIVTADGPRRGRGVFAVAPEDELSFLWPLPVRALWGVGPATAKRLRDLGVETVEELARIPPDTLERAFGSAQSQMLTRMAHGRDTRGVHAQTHAKSIGIEETFASDLHTHPELHRQVVRMADAVGARLEESGLRGRTVTIKVRFADRRTITRSCTLSRGHNASRVVRALAGALLDSLELEQPVRLLGITVSGLTEIGETERQLCFDGPEMQGPGTGRERAIGSVDAAAWEEVESALGAIRSRYGARAVGPASLLGQRGLAHKRRGDAQWGPNDV